MANHMPFSAQDMLDSLMAAAFAPRFEPYIQPDSYGNPQVVHQPTESLISPLMATLRKYIEEDPEFQALLLQEMKARLPEIVSGLVEKVTSSNSAFGVARKDSGWGGRPPTYEVAEWLREPLGEAMAEALTPALLDHYNGEDGKPDFGNATLEVNVVVKP